MKGWVIYFLLLLGLLSLVYIPSLKHGFTFLDDQVQVVNNPTLTSLSFSNLKLIFSSTTVGMYQPVTTIFYALIYQLFSLNPFGYHLVALLFHGLNCLLLYHFLKRLFSDYTLLYLLVAIFALHPMQVESVSWVSAFSNLVYTTFYMLSLIAYLSFVKANRVTKYGMSFLFFLISCLSKSSAVTLPLVLILIDLYKFKSLKKIKWINKLPFLMMSILFGIITINSRESAGHLSDLSIQFDMFQRIFLICHSILFYPIKFLLPFQLSAFYPYPELIDGSMPTQYFLAMPIVLFLVFVVYKNKNISGLWLGSLFFLLSISVVLQFIPVGNQLTTDRYIYLPMIGLLVLIGSLLQKSMKNNRIYLLFLFPLLLAFKSHERAKIWENDQLIWEDVLENHPKVAQAYNNLGSFVLKRNEVQKAFSYFNRAIELKPYYADAYSNRGNLLAQKGDSKAAIQDYTNAIELRPHADAYFNRGNELSKLNDLNSAIEDYTKSIQLKASADAFTNRAFSYLKLKRLQDAKSDLHKSISQFPNYDRAYFLYGLVYQTENNMVQACSNFNKAIQLGNKQAKGAFQQYCLNN